MLEIPDLKNFYDSFEPVQVNSDFKFIIVDQSTQQVVVAAYKKEFIKNKLLIGACPSEIQDQHATMFQNDEH